MKFRLGDHQFELGITHTDHAPTGSVTTPGGAVASWHVDALRATYEVLLAMGAREHVPPVERGEGFVTAAVVDPFGDVLGLIHSPHYRHVLGGGAASSPAP